MLISIRISLAMIGLVALAGCGGGGDGDSTVSSINGVCRVIADNGSTVTTTPAATATFTNPSNVFDANLSTFAVLNTTNGTGTSSIQGTLASGSEPAGEVAGIFFTGSINSNTEVTITTYLKTVQQDTGAALTTADAGGNHFYGLKTTKAFDSIKATLALVNDGTMIQVHELCVGN